MAPTAGVSHDVTIESVGGSPKLGFMQARKQRGLRNWQVKDAPTIQPRIMSMGEMTQAELPPDIELVWFQDEWGEGLGAENHRTDPHKLSAASRKIETGRDGKIRVARDLRQTTVDVAPNGNNGPTGFAIVEPDTLGNPQIWAFIQRHPYRWDHSTNAWVQGIQPNAQSVIYRNGVQFGIKTYAPAWHADIGNMWSLFPYIYKSASDANWVLSTLPQARFRYFAKTRNAAGDPVLWGGFNIYDSTVNTNEILTSSDTTIDVTPDPTSLIANNDIVMVEEEKMLVTARTATTITVVRAYDGSFAATHATGLDIFIYGSHVIRSSTDPTNAGSWSSAVTIGIDDHPITALVADGDTLFVCKTNGVWAYYTDGSTEHLTPDLEQQIHALNFVGSYNWNGHILMPLGTGGLLDLRDGVMRDVSLRNYMPKETTLHGRVLAIHGDTEFVFLLVGAARPDTNPATTESRKYHILRGTFTDDFHWEYLATYSTTNSLIPYDIGGIILVESGDSRWLTGGGNYKHRRVWMSIRYSGATDAEILPRYLPFGRIDDDENDGFSDDTDVEAITGKYDGNLPRVDKQFSKIEIESENLASTRTLDVYYRLDNATAWTSLGTLNTSTAFQTLSFADGVTGKIIQLRFVFTRTGAVSTAADMAVLSFKLTAQLRPTAVKTIPMTVYLADNQLLLNGAMRSSIKGDLSQLRTWNGQAAEVILRTPPEYGSARNCVFLPGTLVEREVAQEHGRRTELECSFLLAEV